MKHIFILLAVLSGLLVSCSDSKTGNMILIKDLSPKESHPEWTTLFTDRYEITPLETTPECLVGQIDKIRKFRGDYYILSSNGSSILHFDTNGKFVSVLDKQGLGPEEYPRIEDFDIYEIDGKTEVWISDNQSLKVYDAADFSYKYKIAYPFVIHKFKRLENSHILLVTGQNEKILTLTDQKGKILSEYLRKEIPYIMFRPVQFVSCGSDYLFQLGISNAFVAFNPQTETFRMGRYTNNESYLSEKQLLELFQIHDNSFILEANKGSYINNLITLGDTFWIQTHQNGKNYLTKIKGEQSVSTEFAYGTTLATISDTESDNSILLYITPDQLAETEKDVFDKFGNKITVGIEDNPYLLEFFE